jgi:hypothetical protein
MEPLTPELVESTWREVASLEPGAARRQMEEAATRQPALLAYVMGSTAHSRPAVQEMAVYLYYVILQMFERAASKRLRAVPISRVERVAKANESHLSKLTVADERFLKRAAEVHTAAQPYVFRYLVEALLEENDSDLTDDEEGLVFLTLKTVIDVLDEAGSATAR